MAEGEAISLLAPATDEWVRLEGPARRIWERLDYPATADAVAAALAAEYDAPPDEIAGAVRSILPELAACGLVAVDEDGGRDPMRDRYLGLLKRALANTLYPELELQVQFLTKGGGSGDSRLETQRFLRDIEERRPDHFARLMAAKQEGGTPYRFAHTMIGLFRLANIERCAERVFADGVEGDFLEAGVCRGGAAIFMRALQIAHGAAERRTWVVDSFQGVPPSVKEVDRRYPVDLEESRAPWVACGERRVRELFSRYDMLDANVEFVAGWVAESLPSAPIGPLAILRVDVDLYSSTWECLDLLYDKVSPGGYVIVDDYGYFECCRDAVEDFRARRGIEEPFEWIDRWGIFWRKPGGREMPAGR
jgi:O-methyltransferase